MTARRTVGVTSQISLAANMAVRVVTSNFLAGQIKKIASALLLLGERRSLLRRNRIYRDMTQPFDRYDDTELYERLRFTRVVDEIGPRI